MKHGKMILSASALIVTVVSAFAFTHSNKKGQARTLFTKPSSGACNQAQCRRNGTGAQCPLVTYYATALCNTSSSVGKIAFAPGL
jgi:hypothetical protein